MALTASAAVIGTVAWAPPASAAPPAAVNLGTASSFGVLANQSITNAGTTTVNGNLGLFPNTAASVTGFPPGTVVGTQNTANAVAQQAQTDAFGPAGAGSAGAYNAVATATPSDNINHAVLGAGMTLGPGVYNATSSMTVDGTLTLQGDPSSIFIFQAGSSLLVGQTNPTSIVLAAAPGASGPVQSCHVFWQVTSSATLGTTAGNPTTFVGTILALQSATLNDLASVDGRVLAGQASVTLNDNDITVPSCATATTTAPSTTQVTLGQTVDDVATVAGNTTDGTPTGTVQTYQCGPGSILCSAATGTAVGSAQTLSGGVATSPAFMPSSLGAYCFASVYTTSANSAYGASAEDGSLVNGECFTVTAAVGVAPPLAPPPTITTTAPSATQVALGQTVDDVATVAGNATDGTPTGTMQTYQCGPGSILCSPATGTAVGSAQTLSGGVATSPSFMPPSLGVYCFASVYTPSAGSAYLASSEAGSLVNGECFTVTAAASVVPPVTTPVTQPVAPPVTPPAAVATPGPAAVPAGPAKTVETAGTVPGGTPNGAPPGSATPPITGGSGTGGSLAFTGAHTEQLGVVALSLQGVGGLLLAASRRKRRLRSGRPSS